mgnify:CR=1 FL=1
MVISYDNKEARVSNECLWIGRRIWEFDSWLSDLQTKNCNVSYSRCRDDYEIVKHDDNQFAPVVYMKINKVSLHPKWSLYL